MNRYSKILEKNPREIILLKSFPCIYGKCSFCNYILDNSTDENEIDLTNLEVIQQVTGEFKILEVINSGSVFELTQRTLDAIKNKAVEKQIKVLYFEVYYGYITRLNEIREYFNGFEVHFRIGVETFDDEFRREVYNKPFPIKNIDELAGQFYGCCLLICVKGQTMQQIANDIELARKHFRETIINVFVDNGTALKKDYSLLKWFLDDIYPEIKEVENIEILIDNKDFGVYVQ